MFILSTVMMDKSGHVYEDIKTVYNSFHVEPFVL